MTDAADTILFDGRITTLDPEIPQAEALAIRDGRILAAGTTAAMMALAGPARRR